MNDDGPSVLTMVIAVAVIVALVIIVFFAIGYLFGEAVPVSGRLRPWNAAARPTSLRRER